MKQKIVPIRGWGVATQNGHGKLSLCYPVCSTRKEVYEQYPHLKGHPRSKVLRVEIRVKP